MMSHDLSANGLLLVGDKITACVKEICLLGVVCKVLNWKTLSGAILINFNVLLQVTYCFFTSC